MLGVLSGFFIITVMVAVGVTLGITGALGPYGRVVLNRVTYYVGTPALVFTALLDSDLSMVLSSSYAIAAISATAAALIAWSAARLLIRNRRPEQTIVTAVSASMVNSANMGFPIAAYVLGDIAFALPVVLWQMGTFTPISQFMIHAVKSGQRPSIRAAASNIAANPTIIAAILGIGLLAGGVTLPTLVVEPVRILGGLSIPGLLIAFGMSLVASTPLAKEDGYRADIAIASTVKLLIMPAIAFAVAFFLFGLRSDALFAAIVLAALPTAQNVYLTAAHYETSEEVARDTALVTSIGTLVVLIATAALFT